MKIIPCDRKYANQVLDIFNDAILNSTALYDYRPRTLEFMQGWFDAKEKNDFPVIGLVDETDQLLGFGSYGTFRAWPAYHYTVEHSLYVNKNHRRKGYGKILLQQLIAQAQKQDYHCLVAAVDSGNKVSIRLHKSSGFEFCGKIRQAGYKFGKWLDLDFYQLLLKTPSTPKEE